MKKNFENTKMCESSAKKIAKIGAGLAVIYTVYKLSVLIHQHIGELKCPFKKKAAESCSEDQTDACSEVEKEAGDNEFSDCADE